MLLTQTTRIAAAVAIAVGLYTATAGPALSAQITGISDQNMGRWSQSTNRIYEGLDLPDARYIAGWDVAMHESDAPCELRCQRFHELEAWLTKARALNKRILISFDYPAGCRRCTPPTASRYSEGVGAFMERFPFVREFTAWNEPNHGNATRRSIPPSLAARYWASLAQACRPGDPPCTVAAGDFSDVAEYDLYTRAYRRALDLRGLAPEAWAIHAYSAVDSNDTAQLDGWIATAPRGRPVWITEVGALYCGPNDRAPRAGSPQAALAYQRQRARNLSELLARMPGTVTRAYYYFLAKPNGTQETCPGFDSALIAQGDAARPALATLFPETAKPAAAMGLDGGEEPSRPWWALALLALPLLLGGILFLARPRSG